MESHYVLNIAVLQKSPFDGVMRYAHYARVRLPHSKADESGAIYTANEFKHRFPEPDFKLDLTYWQGTGYPVEI